MSSKMKLAAVFAISLAAATAWGSVDAVYTIELRDGSRVLAKDRPYHRGSVMVFHRYPSGVLSSLPEEQILRVETQAIEVQSLALRPGDVVFLGTTGAGPASGLSETTVVTAPGTPPGGVYDPRNPAYGGYSGPRNLNANGSSAILLPGVSPSDTAGLTTPEPPTLLVGPNGQPILAPSGAPGSSPPAVGPNGTPVLAPAGAPGSTAPPVGSNGFPARGPGG